VPTRSEARDFKGSDPFVFDGVHAFADVPGVARLGPAEARRLAELGVRTA
jgi:hypothetical protein